MSASNYAMSFENSVLANQKLNAEILGSETFARWLVGPCKYFIVLSHMVNLKCMSLSRKESVNSFEILYWRWGELHGGLWRRKWNKYFYVISYNVGWTLYNIFILTTFLLAEDSKSALALAFSSKSLNFKVNGLQIWSRVNEFSFAKRCFIRMECPYFALTLCFSWFFI